MHQTARQFPPFELKRLLETVFEPQKGERLCILIDLEDPAEITNWAFLKNPVYSIQHLAYKVFYQKLNESLLKEMGLTGGEMFAYKITGGSNLDLPAEAWTPGGKQIHLEKDVYPKYDIILCISTFSATAPLTALAKQHGFRGATLHGLNDIILSTGLTVDYNEVSRTAEALRLSVTRAKSVEIDFVIDGGKCTLHLDLGEQEAQKSHGLCRGKIPDVANLPAGEIYWVPTGAEGEFPLLYEDGTLGITTVTKGRVVSSRLLKGNEKTIAEHNAKLAFDPATGELGELGLGTQVLPVSGRDIQDEKILGTFHVATGRSDHLGGHLTPKSFKTALNATHDDILFAPHKIPDVQVPEVRMHRGDKVEILLQNFRPAPYLQNILDDIPAHS